MPAHSCLSLAPLPTCATKLSSSAVTAQQATADVAGTDPVNKADLTADIKQCFRANIAALHTCCNGGVQSCNVCFETLHRSRKQDDPGHCVIELLCNFPHSCWGNQAVKPTLPTISLTLHPLLDWKQLDHSQQCAKMTIPRSTYDFCQRMC